MLKGKLRAAIVGSILLACTAVVPAIANGLSQNGTEVQQDKMKDNKMGQDKMADNKMRHRRRRHIRHKKPMAGAKMDKMEGNKKQ